MGLDILIVDDEEIVRDIERRVAELAGEELNIRVNIEEGKDGREAVERIKVKEGKYKLVLLDVRMPYKDGRDVYSEIKRDYPFQAKKIVFVTGTPDDIEDITENEKVRYIQKPFHLDLFLNRVKDYLSHE